MPKLSFEPELKQNLREYLASGPFQKAFKRMVKRTIHNNTENCFDIWLLSSDRGAGFRTGSVLGNQSPHSTLDILSSSYQEDVGLAIDDALRMSRKEAFKKFIGVHTHPITVYDPMMYVPSEHDVERVCTEYCFGIVVPVNIMTGELHVVMFQPLSRLSHVAYANLLMETEDKSFESSSAILRLAVERSILRVLEIAKRDPILTDIEIARILESMKLPT